ncbi:MAG: phosphatidylserine/phosphatidylglycerophosphate/cardiolipin synthase family protein [Candidatus Dojkabacteria bacterium]|nr:MAG: phosphatidylserine/phosphatidylglycerophosphate/cardiolipin synthase family protein [Candidatus Dojkabacteria bacterium]
MEFLTWLTDNIEGAQSCIHLNFMEVWLHEEILDPFYDALYRKKSENPLIPVTIAISRASAANPVAAVRFRELQSLGVNVIWTNEDLLTKYQGNNHRKLVVIDDKCAIGGVNLHDDLLNALDYMVVFNNAPALRETILNSIMNASASDTSSTPYDIFDLSDEHTDFKLILENGHADRKSEIIEQAIGLINDAKESVLICGQWLPDDRVLFAVINAAKRGVKIELFANSYVTVGGKLYSFAAWFNQFTVKSWLRGVNIDFTDPDSPVKVTILPKRIHSKLLIVDESSMILGSDNFVRSGAMFQTRESSILVRSAKLVGAILKRFRLDIERSTAP